MEKKNTAVVTVVGNDTIGIIARVSASVSASFIPRQTIAIKSADA